MVRRPERAVFAAQRRLFRVGAARLSVGGIRTGRALKDRLADSPVTDIDKIAHVFVTVSQTPRSGLPGRYAVSVRSAITSRNAGGVPAGWVELRSAAVAVASGQPGPHLEEVRKP
ncbi:hypothetical protein GCM10028790_32100 [Micromonospora taraxaci]